MPHWIIINGTQVFLEHDDKGGGVGRSAPFNETLPETTLELDHLPAKLTIQNVEDDVMEKVVKAIMKEIGRE